MTRETFDPAPSHTAGPYSAALEGAAFADASATGRIWMRGDDRAALLHRLTTNDIERLQSGQGVAAVFTTPIGRMIDLVSVHALDDALLIVTSPGQGPAVYRHLKQNIFFNDKVTLQPAGNTLGRVELYGPQAPAVLAALGLPAELTLHGIATAPWHDAAVLLTRINPIGGQGFALHAPPEQTAALQAALTGAGAVGLDVATHAVLRVEQGYPAIGSEISTEYIPLEANLWDAISFSKGCYVGQEIIARMESRGRLAKVLRGLRLLDAVAAPAPGAPIKLAADGKAAGDLTSVVVSPRFGRIGLAYVRSAFCAPGTRLLAGAVAAEVVELPFHHGEPH
jgi:tRNA-modifying protein YgfZ